MAVFLRAIFSLHDMRVAVGLDDNRRSNSDSSEVLLVVAIMVICVVSTGEKSWVRRRYLDQR